MGHDPATLSALRQGDAAAARWLYQTQARSVLDRVRRLGGPDIDAEDVAHDVFAVAFRRLRSFDPNRGELSAWLYGITRRVVANARRRARLRRMVGLESAPPPRDRRSDAEQILARGEDRQRALRALESLSTRQREVLVLADMEERPAPEVAELLGIPVGTVYSRLHHARRAFRDAVELSAGSSPSVLNRSGRVS